jgi:hypothetical protein
MLKNWIVAMRQKLDFLKISGRNIFPMKILNQLTTKHARKLVPAVLLV